MNAPMLDRARAFDLLAPHLTEDKRIEVATKLADRIVTELPPVGRKPEPPSGEQLDIPDTSPSREVAEFLTKNGLTGMVLVQETVRLNAFLAAHPESNRLEMMRSFLARRNAEKDGA